MWPSILDLDREACLGILRRLELEAYSSVAKALRAQGELNKERRKILSDLGNALSIPLERHKAEMRRVSNDELLSTIALRTGDAGLSSSVQWAMEGRRIIPLLRRARPITSLYGKAEDAKKEATRKTAGILLPPEKTRSKATPPPLKKGKHPAPLSLEDVLTNGVPSVALPQRPNLPEDIVLLPSGMAVRFKREGKGGPFTTEIIPSPLTRTPPPPPPAKETTKKPPKKTVKRKATLPAHSATPLEPPKKPKPVTTSVSQAGHAYARPFGGSGSGSSPAKKPVSSSPVALPNVSHSLSTTPLKALQPPPPPKVVLVADPSSKPSEPFPPPHSLSIKTPPKTHNATMSKETMAKLIQTASSPGARILPKPGGGSQQPIYVLAAPAGTTLASTNLPSARILNATSNTSISSSNNNNNVNHVSNTRPLPRVVQVSGTPVRATLTPPGAAPSSVATAAVLSGIQPIRTIQSSSLSGIRSFNTPVLPSSAPAATIRHHHHHAGKPPSVIVVQRKTPPNSSAQNTLKTTTLSTKDLISKQAKIYQTPKGGAKPLVIVSKSQSPLPSSTSTISQSSNVVTTSTSNQNNVIVLDLSREQLKNNSILSDLLQASGILGDDPDKNKDISGSKASIVTSTPTSHIVPRPEIIVQSPSERMGASLDNHGSSSPKIIMDKPLDNGLQKDNFVKVSGKASSDNNFTEDVNEAVLTIPQTSKSVSLDKVPVEVEGVLHEPESPDETMEDITSFIQETNPNHHHSERGKAN